MVIVFGETCTDRFVYSQIKRLSPEAPVPVLNPINIIENPGMAGNVVQNLKAIDANIEIIQVSQKENITKTRYIEEKTNHMFLRVDEGESNGIDNIVFSELPEKLIYKIKRADAIIVSDYDKGFMDSDFINSISSLGKLNILDSKKKLDKSTIAHFDFIKLNEEEAERNKELIILFPNKFLVTLGSRGVSHGGILYPSENPQETIDVSGAGDTFVAAFTIKYLETKNTTESIIYANRMASIVVSKRGVATP